MKKKRRSANMMQHILLLCVLGLHIYQAAGQDNSTQMYYITLTIEGSAIGNVTTNLLGDFTTGNVSVSQLKMTTSCALGDGNTKQCHCEPGHVWSQKACDSNQCCGTKPCTNTAYTCMSNMTVLINGSLYLDSLKYASCLADSTTDIFKNCNDNLTQTIKGMYSTVDGFDSLSITGYRVGSVIANFVVIIISTIEPSVLQNKSVSLTSRLQATLTLETTGVVQITLPGGLVNNSASVNVTCASNTDLNSQPAWLLTSYQKSQDIHDGTESTIKTSPLQSTISLINVSKRWKGQYTCTFLQRQPQLNITHKASASMDICDLPSIDISTDPGFPLCTNIRDLIEVTASCEVEKNYEVYNVTWQKSNSITASISQQQTINSTGTTIFKAKTLVSCDCKNNPDPTLTCVLTNRCSQTITSTVKVNMIYVNDSFCKADGDWSPAKAGYPAVIKCTNSVGNRIRQCNNNSLWGNEQSRCVNSNLSSLLDTAIIVDVGLGKLDTNVDFVFTNLQSVTNDYKAINSLANINASVTILDTMKLKTKQMDNQSTVNDFLKSSSNLLDETLGISWLQNQTLSEIYLLSVEQLIKKANMTREIKNTNLHVVTCKEKDTPCNNKVFNVTVTIDSKNTDVVKTSGFLQLDEYLPHKDNSTTPNSIVVSTTMQNNKTDIIIDIDFNLFKQRPRNTELKCVYWDNNTSDWSDYNCKWMGGGLCRCTHLSSFTILMSKDPLKLDFLDEMTYIGLSVSIVSLIICLVTELIIWRDVVKTDTLYLRHCGHVNISVCLLVGDVCFLASNLPGKLTDIWCQTFVVLEHFCYLAMFFWMFCLSSILLHKTVYVSLHGIGKTAYLRYSIIVGYICPLLIVVITFIANGGEEGRYYSKDTRWLVYNGMFQGSIFTFILPVGVIVFVNVFFMCLVIMKLLQPIKAQQMLQDKEKNSAKTVIRSVILLTPVFGLTWGLGFVVIIVDLTNGPIAYAVNYLFTIMNAFQGLFIFLTTCAGDKMVREGLRRYFSKKTTGGSSISNSTITLNSSIKK